MKKALMILCILLFVLLIFTLLMPQFWAEKQRAYRDENHKYESYKEEFAAAKKECMKLLNNREFCLLADALYEESSEGEETYYQLYRGSLSKIENPLISEDISIFIPSLLNPNYDSDMPAPEKVLQAYDDFYTAYTDNANGLLYRYHARKAVGSLYRFFDKVCVNKDSEKGYIRFYLAGSFGDHIYLVRGAPEDAMIFKRFLGHVKKDPEGFDIILYSKCTDTPYTWYLIAFS